MNKSIPLAITVLLAALSPTASAAGQANPAVRHLDQTDALDRIRAAATPLDKDRQAILAMQGEYEALFNFDESVVYKPGYRRGSPNQSAGYEWVVVIEDSPGRIVLQHILVSSSGAHVTKHWRQDWHYQVGQRLEYSQDQTWRLRDIPADRVQGHWTQCVYEVSDAPRYCGTGRWEHGFAASTWQSDAGWRPLPRREYTKREDYNALQVVNRHRIVDGGWTHEQDNIKVLREGETPVEWIVGERGFNDYRAIQGHDFAPGRRYWQGTADYWARVRAEWDRRVAEHGGIRLILPQTDMTPIVALFAQADREKDGQVVSDAEISRAFDDWTTSP